MKRATRRAAAVAALVIAIVIAAVAAFALARGGPDPGKAADAYLAAWSGGEDAGAARATDRPGAARTALEASREGLDGARLPARRTGLEHDGARATARVRVTWKVPRIGDLAYDTSLALEERDDRWVVAFSPKAVHPRLTGDTRLGTAVDAPNRGDVLDRDGRRLITERSVMDVALQTDRVRDRRGTAEQVAELIGDVDADDLEGRLHDAGPGRFVPVITLRAADFEEIADRLRRVRGISLAPSEAPLAPSRDFGRAVLGAVGP